jgi:hypothetical protein
MGTHAQRRTRRDHSLWDQRVNDLWNGQQPVLSPEESLTAAKKLYRHAMGKAWKGKWALVSGNRHTWPKYGTFYVNPARKPKWSHGAATTGLREIIHGISHYCHWKLHPGDKPHSIRQLRLEAKLTKFAIDRKWHEGALKKPEPPEPEAKAKPDVICLRYKRMVNRRDKWSAELERAKRLYAKAQREVRAYERRHGERLTATAA